MRELLNFFQEIFMLKKEDNLFVGLSQFKYSKAPIAQPKPQAKSTEVKLSDLMRKSVYK